VSTVTAVLAHVSAPDVDERVELLQTVAPEARFIVCYGGPAREFERLAHAEKLFVDDPTLRGAAQHLQSLTRTFELLWATAFRDDRQADALYLVEYDHLILDPGFEERLSTLGARTGADVMGKNCVERTASNDEHYIRFRRDARLLAHLRRLSVRDDPTRQFGCLGDGIWLSRRALQAYVEVGDHPPCYCEIYVPTLLHHLGLRLVDIDAHGDLYRYVRWTPPYSTPEVIDGRRQGAAFIHPVKDLEAVRAVREAVGERR
jgi:hypothetical protein